jgi:UDP-glucose 4,6-dehydratase
MGDTVVANVHAGVTISDPFGISRAARARRHALDPEFTKRPYFFPKILATFSSNSIVLGPNPASHPSCKHSMTARISSGPYDSNLFGAYQIFLLIDLKSMIIFNSMNLLVTGGCGFVGSHFINHYIDKCALIVNLDILEYCSSETNVVPQDNYVFVHGDINDRALVAKLLEEYSINIVVHFAAHTHVDNSFVNSLDFTRVNVLGTHTLIDCCKNYGKLDKFIHMSTDEVYGEVDIDHPGCSEHTILNPTNPYAATKAAAEFIVRSYNYSFKLPIIIVRCNNVYGPNQYPEKIIAKFIHLLRNNQKCTIHGRGQSRRNFIHAHDVASAFGYIIKYGSDARIYNIGTTNEYNVLEIVQKLIHLMKPDQDYKDWIEFVPERNFNDFRYAIDTSELLELGWKETIPFDDGLCDLVSNH